MKKGIRLLLEGMKQSVKAQITYRADYILNNIISIAANFIIPLVTLLIYRHGATFPGWSLYEVMLIQGLFMLTESISDSFFSGIIWNTLSSIREGTFDLILIKPVNTLPMIMISSLSFDLGPFLGGVALTTISIIQLGGITVHSALLSLFLCIISLLLQLSLSVVMGALVFKWVGNSRVYEILSSIKAFGKYPGTLFARPLSVLLTWIIPVLAIAYFPAAALLGRRPSGIVPAVLSSILFLIFSLLLWRHMVKKYTSAGG